MSKQEEETEGWAKRRRRGRGEQTGGEEGGVSKKVHPQNCSCSPSTHQKRSD